MMKTSVIDDQAAWDLWRVEVAPYALVRLSAVPYWPDSDAQTRFRHLVHHLVEIEHDLAALSRPLGQALYDSRSSHSEGFHRRVVLPLRRDVHNRRRPASKRRSGIGDLRARMPQLDRWLRAVDERERVRRELAEAVDAALEAERAAMAIVCSAEPLRRAIALSSAALLVGMEKATIAGAHPDAGARKREPKILRYALRATTKTSPWSWFTAVGWGEWNPDGDDVRRAEWQSVSVPNAAFVLMLVRALLALPRIRWRVPHRAPRALTIDGRYVRFHRDDVTVVQQNVSTHEHRVRLPRTGPLDLLLSELRRAGPAGRTLQQLADSMAQRLPEGAWDRAVWYLDRLADEQLLVPMPPIDPQAVDPLPALADWSIEHDQDELAAMLRAIDRDTRRFGDLSAAERPEALRRLDEHWAAVFARVGANKPAMPPVKEDVVLRGRTGRGIALDHDFGRDLRGDLARLAPLTELFNNAAILRGLLRRRLIDRYGPGGVCRVAELVPDGAALWAASATVAPDGVIDPLPDGVSWPLPAEVEELAVLRREITAAIRAAEPRDGEVGLPDQLIAQVADALPAWLVRRPSSYSYFIQPFRSGSRTGWCVNAIGDGWGRFASRFLSALGPGPTEAVARQVRDALTGRRVAQYRPVAGLNVNLHPLLVADEVGEAPDWSTLLADELEVVHDPDADELRLRVAATGEPVDVLYLGFLLQSILPDRAVPLYLDLGAGRARLAPLAPAEPIDVAGRRVWRRHRLSYRGLVLARRAWSLDSVAAADLRTDLHDDGPVPVAAAARWSAALGLPDATFMSATGEDPFRNPVALRAYLARPKPQFVDLGSALHLRCLARLPALRNGPVRIEEALPVPGEGPAGRRAIELIVETYSTRRQRP